MVSPEPIHILFYLKMSKKEAITTIDLGLKGFLQWERIEVCNKENSHPKVKITFYILLCSFLRQDGCLVILS